MRLQACAFAMLFAGLPLPAAAASLFDPALRFRTLPTEHFVIYFHQGEDRLAQRLAVIAEETWRTLQQPLGIAPPRRTHVVLADQTDVANGYATPLPYDTIVIYTVVSSGADFNFDDWLRLVFTHEFTHIVHLDRSEGWARVVRSIFGRTPIAFPNLFLPAWQIEGLATYEESAITGTGRLHAGDFRAIVDEAARAHALEPLDRANGGLTDWPGGATVYAYGLGFHEYLVDRFGPEKLAALAEATARRLPYTASRAFKRVYGEGLGALWREYETSVTRVTHQGFSVRGPRFDRFPCASCPVEIVYSASNPHGFPAMYRVGLDGAPPREIAKRYQGSTTAIGRDAVYFDQLEIRRNVGVYSDLYELSRSDGRIRQLTQESRLLDPDLSPDGETLVCVQDRPGQRDLVLVRLRPAATTGRPSARGNSALNDELTTLIAEAETQFDTPRWSPDGRTVAVERHRVGAMPEIVLVDVATRAVRVIAAAAGIRFVTPAWRPDGGAIVAAAAPDDETFNLVELNLDGSTARQLTGTTGGATWPDVSPDGRTIVFVGYTTDGFDLFAMPYPSRGGSIFQGGQRNEGSKDEPLAQDNRSAADLAVRSTAGYSPLSTLKPTSWSPIVEAGGDQVRVGAGVDGVDVLGYHAYAGTATWLVSSPDGAPEPNAATPDWQAYYAYRRWRPTFYASAARETSFFAGAATDAGTPTAATRRERQLQAGILFPIRHARVVHAGLLSVVRARDDYLLANGALSRDRLPLRAAWQTITGRTYGYSISREHGVAAGTTAELVRRGLGSFADATTLTGDARVYLPALAPHHVLAVRVGGGASTGDPTVGRTFLLGGDAPAEEVVDFGSSAFSLLRGFGRNTFAGSRVAVANAEYRWPIARPQRGIGTWPIFVHSIHGAVFADAGHAWTETFRAGDIKTSAGAQLSVDIVAGYFAPFTATVGAAWGRDGSGIVSDRMTAFVHIGRAF
jgi:Omp85 superfamily domain/WD40-like Beta Propeller Repeat